MDFHLYYLEDKNKYTIHFLNKKKLSTFEIINICKQYGNVLGVNRAGNETGMHFVSFKTLAETLNCIHGLRYNDRIKLLPEREKVQKNLVKKECEVKKDDTIEEVFTNESNMLNINKEQKPFKEVLLNDIKDSENNEGSNVSSELLSVNEESANLSINNITPEKSFLENDEANDFEIPNIIRADRYTHARSIESLGEISSYTCSVTEDKSVLAQEVIVANIPKEFSIFCILHIFREFNPIAISLMKEIHSTGILYCHIYFRNPQDAYRAEIAFDKLHILDVSLIVLRSDRLLKEIEME